MLDHDRAIVLVVDPVEGDRHAITRPLIEAGYRIIQAATAAEAFAAIEQERPDLVVLAMRLPDLPGIEVCRRIKGASEPGAPLILGMSPTAAPSDDKIGALAAGADAYLVPPIESRELLAYAESLLRLRRAERRLLQSNQELERFAAVAAHDLQEPLRTIASHLVTVQEQVQGRLDTRGERALAFVIDGSQRLQGLIEDLLRFSRLKHRGVEATTFAAADVAREAVELLAARIAEAGAAVEVGAMPAVHADRTLLRQVFQNLIANSVKFRAPDRPPRIAVDGATDGADWRFRVRDDGIGVPREHLDRVFQPYFRVHPRSRYAGNGLGLAACRMIVERHGGRIWLESEKGAGTTVHFTLPQAASSVETAAPAMTADELGNR